MTSLKRAWIFHEENTSEHYIELLGQKSPHQERTFSEIPILEDKSWPDLWSDLLTADSSNGSFDFGASYADAANHNAWDTEDCIESWAGQSLPWLQSLPASAEAPQANTHLEDLIVDAPYQLCYGMIYRAAVQLLGDMSQVQLKINSSDRLHKTNNIVFDITKSSTNLVLVFSDGTEFALLNTHTAKALDCVMDLPSVQLEALVDLASLRDTLHRVTKAREATIRVNINVYGPIATRKDVGRVLSAGKVYLQHPDHKRSESKYDNPHVIAFPGIKAPGPNLGLKTTSKDVVLGDRPENFQKAVSNVYSSLKRSSHLKRWEGDTRIITPLLKHQEEALDFMMQRELGPVPLEFSLWRPAESSGQAGFRHIITKAESLAPPPETGGGVLADEMGMGKSLSILALITKTLENAHVWARGSNLAPSNDLSDAKYRSRGTLIVASSGLLLNNWNFEIDKHLDRTLKITKYHGQKRETQIHVLADSDIVLTTYHTLAADFTAKRSPNHEIGWFRVVLDEAHIIRRRATTLYQTVSELTANYRWCLTGSPIQNALEDIGALFAFIRAKPFDSIATFRRFIATPFDESEEGRERASVRLSLLLDSVCLRRMKKESLSLPDQKDRTRVIELSKEERQQYESTKKIMNRALRTKVGEIERKKDFGMFQVQLQLRILTNHGTFQQPFSWANHRNLQMEREDALFSFGQRGDIKCSSCTQVMPILGTNRVYRTYPERCAHILCLECLDEQVEENAVEGGVVLRCPLCNPVDVTQTVSNFDYGTTQQVEEQGDYFRPHGYSSKVAALVADVQEDLWQTKSVIFSCWTKTLDLIARHLRPHSIPFERIDGECPLHRRQQVLDDFATNPNMPVLIMTTGTGAYGLNLTAANRVFIVEPQWNPSVENQAIARALRLGQHESVLVTRYIVKGTVEQEMRSQQDRKLRIAEIGWEPSQSQSWF